MGDTFLWKYFERLASSGLPINTEAKTQNPPIIFARENVGLWRNLQCYSIENFIRHVASSESLVSRRMPYLDLKRVLLAKQTKTK